MTNRRFLSLWWPRLATDRARRAHRVDATAPLVAVAMIKNARRLVGVDANAARLGLSVGLTLADARARHPALVACEADPAAEAKLKQRIIDLKKQVVADRSIFRASRFRSFPPGAGGGPRVHP